MDHRHIRYNMEEIIEEASTILHNLKRGNAYSLEEYYHSMAHLIHHVNTAWNARDVSLETAEQAPPDLRQQWNQYPTDIRLV
jgi:hypothetical protein